MDSRNALQAHINPNPFNSAESMDEVGSWTRNLASAGSGTTTQSSAQSFHKEKSRSSDDERLAKVSAVRSAAHAAKQKLHLHSVKASGPSNVFNPTNVRVQVQWKDAESSSRSSGTEEQAFLWRSRDNRKGRNSIAVPTSSSKPRTIPIGFRLKKTSRNVLRMCTTFPYWDMAFWSGWAYAMGSILFVIDCAWSWKKVAMPGSEPKVLTKLAGPLCFFFGAIFYQIGATMAYFEAVNDGSFQGSAMRRFLEGNESDSKKMLDAKIHSFFGHLVPHHHDQDQSMVDPEAGWKAMHSRERPGSIYPSGKAPAPRRAAVDLGEAEEGTGSVYMTWRWWPSWHALRTHHIYEIGYIACAIQLFGATLYGVTAIVDLPGVMDDLADWQVEASFWIPQIVASCCFITASVLFTLETQQKWYRPAPTVLGWWIGAWALVGSVGFLLCGVFGAASYDVSWGEYQADLSGTWGSAAFLISSLFQWYEAINKRPIEELYEETGEMKSFQVRA